MISSLYSVDDSALPERKEGESRVFYNNHAIILPSSEVHANVVQSMLTHP